MRTSLYATYHGSKNYFLQKIQNFWCLVSFGNICTPISLNWVINKHILPDSTNRLTRGETELPRWENSLKIYKTNEQTSKGSNLYFILKKRVDVSSGVMSAKARGGYRRGLIPQPTSSLLSEKKRTQNGFGIKNFDVWPGNNTTW